jgi:hypothetical protein
VTRITRSGGFCDGAHKNRSVRWPDMTKIAAMEPRRSSNLIEYHHQHGCNG